jgi:hypothetical protein
MFGGHLAKEAVFHVFFLLPSGIMPVRHTFALQLSCPWWAICLDWETGMVKISYLIQSVVKQYMWISTAFSTRYAEVLKIL